MTKAEAIRILDPETSREALDPYRLDCELMRVKMDEACRVAVEAMRELEAVKKCKRRCAVCTCRGYTLFIGGEEVQT